MSNETTTPTPELAPCPACGGKPYLSTAHRIYSDYWVGSHVYCTDCKAYGPDITRANCETETEGRIAAAAAWNALAADVQRGKMAAKMAEALRQAWWILDGHQTSYCIVNAGILAEYDALTAKEAN